VVVIAVVVVIVVVVFVVVFVFKYERRQSALELRPKAEYTIPYIRLQLALSCH